MPQRAINSDTACARNDVATSMFSQRTMPDLPRGLPKDIRKRAKDLLEMNTHLWTIDQIPSVIRLVQMQKHFDQANTELEQLGMLVENDKGDLKANPILSALTTLASKILSMERALGITFSARNNNVKEAEKKVTEAPAPRGRPGRPKIVRMA